MRNNVVDISLFKRAAINRELEQDFEYDETDMDDSDEARMSRIATAIVLLAALAFNFACWYAIVAYAWPMLRNLIIG